MGYAIRHVADLESTFREYWRILRPGGIVLVIELSRPAPHTLRYFFSRIYLREVVPRIARLGRGKDAATLMRYFWDTMDSCVPPEVILQALGECGFVQLERKNLYGAFSEYVAVKPVA